MFAYANTKKKRAEIFNEDVLRGKKNRSSKRVKRFWTNVNQTRKSLLSTLYDNPNDIRPYANVSIGDENYLGLPDTGASISCLGSKAARKLLDSDRSFKKIRSFARTAEGKSQEVCGYWETEISFRGVAKPIKLYIVPNFSQDLYIGIDFWRTYDILPVGLVSELDSYIKPMNISEDFIQRPLSELQKSNRWQRSKLIHQNFCERWKREYLKEMNKRIKWKKPAVDIQEGDMVIVKEENLPPNS